MPSIIPSEDIVFESYESALRSLKDALDAPYNEFVRDATIQRFEYSMELSWKTLKRFLKVVYEVDEAAVRELFRKAQRFQIIPDAGRWILYLERRNLTSHTYNEHTAQDVYNVIGPFYRDACALLEAMQDGYRRHKG